YRPKLCPLPAARPLSGLEAEIFLSACQKRKKTLPARARAGNELSPFLRVQFRLEDPTSGSRWKHPRSGAEIPGLLQPRLPAARSSRGLLTLKRPVSQYPLVGPDHRSSLRCQCSHRKQCCPQRWAAPDLTTPVLSIYPCFQPRAFLP